MTRALTPLLIALGVLVAVFAVVSVWRTDPAQGSIFPPCRFHELTGLQCPGCGATRATHQLLHGNVSRAFYFNALYVSLLPVLFGWGVVGVRHWWREQPMSDRGRRLNAIVGFTMLGLLLAFWVVRNLPGWPLL